MRQALWVCLALAACGRSNGSKADGADALGAVQAPAGLLVAMALRDPDAAWSRLQRGAGGPLSLLPPRVGDLACAALGLDANLGALVDGHAGAYGVVLQHAAADGGDLGWAVAIPLTDDGARRLAALPSSALPAGIVERSEAGMRILTRPAAPLPAAMAIAGRWILVACDEGSLLSSGPYVMRTLPADGSLASRASLVARASHDALAGPIADSLASAWATARTWLLERERSERATHGGREADFGDPEAIVGAVDAAAAHRLASIAGARELRLEAETGSDDITVEVRALMDSPARDALASTAQGDARPLADVPADTPFALLVRDDADGRARAARDLATTLAQVLGNRVHDEEARAIGAALDDWTQARGDWMALGLARSADGFWIRAPARQDDASRAVREVLALSSLPPIRAPIEGWLHRRPPTFGSTGAATIAMFPPVAGGPARPAVGVAWSTTAGELTIGAGVRPLERLVEATSPGSKWGDDTRTARVLAALGDATTFAALAEPLRFNAVQSASAPLALAWGVRGDDPCARIDIADELLAAALRPRF